MSATKYNMQAKKPDVSELWIQHQRRNNKTTLSWACIFCEDRRIFISEADLWEHAQTQHHERLPAHNGDLEPFRNSFTVESAKKKPTKDGSQRAQPEPPPAPAQRIRDLNTPGRLDPTRSISGLGALNVSTPRGSEHVAMQDLSEDGQATEILPRKRAAVEDGISAGSGSPLRDSSDSLPLHRSKARPASGLHGSTSDPDTLPRDSPSTQGRLYTPKRQLWSPDQEAPLTKASFNDPSNIASVQLQKSRAQALQPRSRKPFQPPSIQSTRSPRHSPNEHSSALENYEIILQPETRPISQEQLVAEVKGIYAGLVMVEAKCIEVDNNKAALAQADPSAQPKLDNEQWQALIALHRTLLHEHHDFFLASQHPSASPALHRLASKYAMPARMWRHGIHSFLELLRHRLPASLDHMMAFIYLAHSMMALLHEAVPAFEDIWIECLGDLGRYRMSIEDDDIRDREVWTGVARHWYSKASEKASSRRLYHHLAVLARPNALQQLFYYSKELSSTILFTSAREWILTLFEAVLNTENVPGRYRLSPLDLSFVKTEGLLFAKLLSKSPSISEARSMILEHLNLEERLGEYINARKRPWSSRKLQSNTQHLEDHPNIAVGNQFLVPCSVNLGHLFRRLQRYSGFLGASVIWGQIRLVAASSIETTEAVDASSTHLLEVTALAATLGLGFMSIRFAKGHWNIDLLFSANIVIPAACLYVALDHGFSNHKLFVIWLYGLVLDFVWLRDKVLRFSRSAGLIGLLLPLIGFLTASQFIHHFPELESRFNNQVVTTAILSLPTTVFWSLTWVAAFERTGFAGELESGAYNSHIFGFIKHVFDAFIFRMVERAIESVAAYFFGERVPNYENNVFGRPPQDVEALPREFVPIPRHEPFRGPNNGNIHRPESEEGFPDEWQNRPGQY